MPITALQQERLQRALSDHDAALRSNERQLSSSSAKVHQILLQLGRNEKVLALIDEFVDSPDVSDQLRRDPAAELLARDIQLPDNVTVHVLDGYGFDLKPILRFEIRVRNAIVLADWDPNVGPCVKLART